LSKSREKQERDAVTKRLDAIIRLLMESQLSPGKVKKGKLLLLLESSGLSTAEIGLIEGRASKDVASTMRKARSGR
jgi:DNA-directed RNA polymerase specialized sigma24 family protein